MNLKMQTAHHHQPEVHLALDRTSPPLDYSPHRSPYNSRTIQPPPPSPQTLHLKPPCCSWHGLLCPLRLLFTYNPLKHLSCITYCVPVYTFGTRAIHLMFQY